ncbi:tRNA pseudouridine(55) synthase TruB [Humidisolicoccus flavus]|uniref:tRNA pseudouridine(55) synthase TruB n=1 Tax=Humidisolicoccus flavus TaxID=3111414 RepID=UPI00324D63E2
MTKQTQAAPRGLLLVQKPAGITSHGVVARARKALNTRKIGHAGTLDPMATGLLVLGVGSATRLLTFIVGADKQYTATIRLGAASSTDDAEGELGTPVDASMVTSAQLTAARDALLGDIEQRPSAVSAIKVDGKRAYARVREGETVELKSRPVTIARFDLGPPRLVEHDAGAFLDVDVVIDCSSGTYIRALARDLGEALGVGGHLTVLERTRVGQFLLSEAVTLEDLSRESLHPARSIVERIMPAIELGAEDAGALSLGKRPENDAAPGRYAAVHGDRLLGIADADGSKLRVVTNFPEDE